MGKKSSTQVCDDLLSIVMKNITNPIYSELKKLKLITDKNLIVFHKRTRDKNIPIIKDTKTEIIFLKKKITNTDYYSSLQYKKNHRKNSVNKLIPFEEIKIANKKTSSKYVKPEKLNDNLRRKNQFNKILYNKEVLDYGCGWGGFLSTLNKAKSLSGVELRKECIGRIKTSIKKINISDNINFFKKKFDVINLFHVLENLPNQVKIFKSIHSKLKKNGKIIIEVPHAKDFLILQDGLKEFRNFTFWSEHLILHTENSLKKILSESGYKKINIIFYQRYSFFNHLGWFIKRKPGFHKFYEKYFTKKTSNLYSENLVKIKQTDTLIAIAEK